MIRKYNINYVRNFLLEKNIKLLSDVYVSCNKKLDVECLKCGYVWHPTFTNLKNGSSNCKICSFEKVANDKKCDTKIIISTLLKKGLILITKEYKNMHQRLNVECVKCGYRWESSFVSLKSVRGCKRCNGCAKLTLEQLKKEFYDKNLILITDFYKNNTQMMTVRCKECNYLWTSRVDHLRACFCPQCSGYKPYKYEEIKNYLLKNKLLLLTEEESYKNVKTKIRIKCLVCFHEYEKTFDSIKNRGTGCNNCRMFLNQKKLYKIISDIFPNYNCFLNYKNFDWLTNEETGHKQEIDIFVKDYNSDFSLAIEYDGEQHFVPLERMGGTKKFEYQKKMDMIKNCKINQHKDDIKYFIRVSYRDKITSNNVKRILNKNNILIHGEHKK